MDEMATAENGATILEALLLLWLGYYDHADESNTGQKIMIVVSVVVENITEWFNIAFIYIHKINSFIFFFRACF